jgi:hypothetical protein
MDWPRRCREHFIPSRKELLGMSPESGDHRTTEREERAWLLDCEGMRVEAADSLVGFVVAPLYEFSARWDRPWALSVRTDAGAAIVRMEAIERVIPDEKRIIVRETPLVDLDVPPSV